jgi:hypothetical protein
MRARSGRPSRLRSRPVNAATARAGGLAWRASSADRGSVAAPRSVARGGRRAFTPHESRPLYTFSGLASLGGLITAAVPLLAMVTAARFARSWSREARGPGTLPSEAPLIPAEQRGHGGPKGVYPPVLLPGV